MKTIFKRASKSTLAVVLAVCLLFSCMTVGIIATDAARVSSQAVGAGGSLTVYYGSATVDTWYENSRTVKMNVNTGAGWPGAVDMTDTGETIDGHHVYSGTVTVTSDDLYEIQIQEYDGSTWKSQIPLLNNTKTAYSTVNGKFYNGSAWVTPVYDAVSNPAASTVSLSQTTSGTIYAGETSVSFQYTVSGLQSGCSATMYIDGSSAGSVTAGNNLTWTHTFATAGTYSVKLVASGNGFDNVESSAVSVTVSNRPTIYINLGNSDNNWSEDYAGNSNTMTYDPTASATVGGTAEIYKFEVALTASLDCYWRIWDGSANYRPSSEITEEKLLSGNGVSGENNATPKKVTTDEAGTYIFYYDYVNHTFYVDYPSEDKYTVTIDAGSYGSVSTNSMQVGATAKTLPTVTDITDGYSFNSWTVTSGGNDITLTDAGTNGSATVSASGAGTVTATYNAPTYTIVGDEGLMGTGNGWKTDGNEMTYSNGTYSYTVTGVNAGTYSYKAIRNHSYDWEYPSGYGNSNSVEVTNNNSTVTFTLDPSTPTLTAVVSGGNYDVTTSAENGTAYISTSSPVSGNATSVNLDAATNPHTVYVKATPNTDYEVSGWQVDGVTFTPSTTTSGDTVTASFSVTGECTITPSFAKKSFTVAIDSGITNGTVSVSPASYQWGTTVNLTVAPDSGYQPGTITVTKAGGGTVTVTNNSFEMPKDNVTVTATFTEIPYILGYKVQDADDSTIQYVTFTNGSASANLDANTTYEFWINYGTSYYKDLSGGTGDHMTRGNSANWVFSNNNLGNSKIDTDLGGNYTFTFSNSNDNLLVSVAYPPETNYTVTFANGDHGTVSPSNATVSNVSGYDLSNVTVTPDAGYKHTGWTVTSGTATISDGKVYPTSACTVTATIEEELNTTFYILDNDKVSSTTNMYLWNGSTKLNGDWPGTEIGSTTETIEGKTYFVVTEEIAQSTFSLILNNGGDGDKSADLTDLAYRTKHYIKWTLDGIVDSATPYVDNYYLTGWLNGESITTTDNSRKFTKQQDGTYTLDYTFTGNQGGSQYVTIFDGTNAYHPATHKSGTGTAGSTVNTSPGEDPKWEVVATTDQTVHFTYNPNTKVLSWTVDSLATTYRVVGSATFFGTAWDTSTASSSYNYMMGASSGTKTADGTSFTYDYCSGPHTASVAYGSFDFKVFGTDNSWNPSDNVTVPGLKKDQQIYFYFNSSTGAVTYAIVGNGTEDPWPPTDITTLNPGDVQYNSLIYNISGGSNNITTNKSTLDGLKQVKSVADAGNGGWWADFTDLLPSIGTNQLYFNITSNGNYTGFYATSNMTFDTTNAPGISVKSTNKDSTYYFVEVSGVDSALTHLGVYITKDGSNNFTYKFYTVKAAASAVKTVKIYAKDGAIRRLGTARDPRSNMTYSTFEQHANTFVYSDQAMTQHIGTRSSTHGASGNDELTDTNVFDRYTYDYVAKQNKGTTIYIKTVLDSTYIQQQYYVKGFSINGTVYNLYSYNNTGVYTEEFTIPEDWAKNYVEITPIFQKVENADNVIRFYVEGFDKEVQDAGWGDTLGVYPFYQNEATNAYVGNINNPFGGYPGQPMIFYKGNYYIELPKSYQTNDEGGGTYTATIKGVTLSNMYWDDVHLYTGEVNTHMQTYDFDDLYKIYKEYGSNQDFDKIVCAYKYRTQKNNDEPQSFETGKVSDYTNGWELLKNYKGEAIDVFGNVLSNQEAAFAKTASSSDVVHIISQDYKSNSAGDYATEWAIYDTTGAKITGGGKNTIVPSALEIAPSLVSGSSNNYTAGFEKYDAQTRAFKDIYNNLYNDQDVLGKPAFITYEKSIYGGGDKADRCDARWFFSRKELVNAKVLIEYSDDLGKTWTADAFNSNATGTHTGCTAYFQGISTNADNIVDSGKAYPDYTTDTTGKTPTSTIGDGYYVFNSASAGQYEFVGWYVLRDNYLLNAGKNDYGRVTGDFTSHAEIAKNGDIFVVRYIKAAHGSFTINHEVHPQSTGFGDVYVQAVVKNAGNTLATYGDATSSHITIPNEDGYINDTEGNIIEAKFTPDPYGTSSFVNFYATVDSLLKDFNEYDYIKSIELVNMPGSDGYNASNETYALVTYDVNKLFVGGTQKYTSVTHYSKFTLKTDVNYKLYYTFNTRYYGTKNYEYDQSFTEQELRSYFYDQITQKNVSTIKIDKQFVYSKAPFESNYREDLTWDVNKVEVEENTGRLTATQVKKKTVRATFYDVQNVNNSCVVVTETYTTPYMKVFDVENSCPEVTSEDFDSFPAADCALYQPKLRTSANNQPVYIDHWDIYRLDTITFVRDAQNNYTFEQDGINIKVDAKSDLVAKCYSPEFNYAGFDDYAVIPVYSTEYHNQQQASDALPQTGSATLLTITRNHWNNTTNGIATEFGAYDEPNTNYDRIYVDFMLNYNYKDGNGKNILLNSINDNNIVVGFVIKSYTWKGGNKEYRGNAKTVVVDKSKIDNKNRLEYCYGFNNTQNNSQYGLNFEFTPFIIDTTKTGTDIAYNNANYSNLLADPTPLQNVNFYMIGKPDTPWN